MYRASYTARVEDGAIVVEDMDRGRSVTNDAENVIADLRELRAKAGLNRSILDQGWGMFRAMLAWKLRERGGRLVEVPAHNTASTHTDTGGEFAGRLISRS